MSATTGLDQPTVGCRGCQERQGGCCPACAARRRRRALALRERYGLGDEQIAARLDVSVERARRLIEEAERLRDLQQYKCDSIPLGPIRELFGRRLDEDPTLSRARVAEMVGTDRAELLRAVGLQPTASRLVGGERRPGKLRSRITVEMAGRIVVALGVAPHEVPWPQGAASLVTRFSVERHARAGKAGEGRVVGGLVKPLPARVIERRRAAALARHYREREGLSVAQISQRLGRSPATVRAYLYDPDGSKARRVKEGYRGECSRCGAQTSGAGPDRSRTLCARCNGRLSARWDEQGIGRALRAWFERYGRQASGADLSLAYARARAPRDGGVRLRRLQQGWEGGSWPAASVVRYHYRSVRAANRAALGAQRETAPQ